MLIVYILLGVSGTMMFFGLIGMLFQNKTDKTYSVNCDYNLLCNNIINWSLGNIPPIKSNQKLTLKISSYEHKKTMAVFYPHNKEIKIYIKNHDGVCEIVDSLLHEVTHYKQYLRSPRTNHKEYQKLLGLYGYTNHPMEIEAINTANNYKKDCLKYLERNGFIV